MVLLQWLQHVKSCQTAEAHRTPTKLTFVGLRDGGYLAISKVALPRNQDSGTKETWGEL